METKLNRLTSPGRCVATGTDSPPPSPGAEVVVATEAGGGGDAPVWPPCPCRLLPAPPRRVSCSGAAAVIPELYLLATEGDQPQRRKRRRRRLSPGRSSRAPLWPKCGCSQPGFLSQREVLVRSHPSDCRFLFLPGQGAGGSTGCFHSPPLQSPRKSLPSVVTCLGSVDTGLCSCLPPVLHLTRASVL